MFNAGTTRADGNDMDVSKPFARRIGERKQLSPLTVGWTTQHVERGGVLGRKKVRTLQQSGRLLDISVSGAAILAPRFPGLRQGCSVLISFEGFEGVVEVRRWEPTEDDDLLRYGVQFVDMDPRLKDRLFEVLGQDRPGEEVWLAAP